jgi:murein endopeptidase
MLFILLLSFLMNSLTGLSLKASDVYSFLPDQPESDFLVSSDAETSKNGSGEAGPTLEFCRQWNPEFSYRGNRCCAPVGPKMVRVRKSKRLKASKGNRCEPRRSTGVYCQEMTSEQKAYRQWLKETDLDIYPTLLKEAGKYGQQSYCTVNNGFLAYGRELIPTTHNRIELRSAERCTNFGTDTMIGLLEYLGHRIHEVYSDPKLTQVKLLVGDISAPRGGCLAGRNGRRGHASHMAGLDVDIAFFNPQYEKDSAKSFEKNFDVGTNWWLLKQIFNNPFACVQKIFLDRKLIAKLGRTISREPEWKGIIPYLRHVKGHNNHFHVLLGNTLGKKPGQLGCADMGEDEEEMDNDEADSSLEQLSQLSPQDFESKILNRSLASSEVSSGASSGVKNIKKTTLQRNGK